MFLWEDTRLLKYLVEMDSGNPIYEHGLPPSDRLNKKLR